MFPGQLVGENLLGSEQVITRKKTSKTDLNTGQSQKIANAAQEEETSPQETVKNKGTLDILKIFAYSR